MVLYLKELRKVIVKINKVVRKFIIVVSKNWYVKLVVFLFVKNN